MSKTNLGIQLNRINSIPIGEKANLHVFIL